MDKQPNQPPQFLPYFHPVEPNSIPYFSINVVPFPYFPTNQFTNSPNNYPPNQPNVSPTSPNHYKLQEGAENLKQIQPQLRAGENKKPRTQRKDEIDKSQKETKPNIKHLAKYFDPVEAPLITSMRYFEVESLLKQFKDNRPSEGILLESHSPTLKSQRNDNPFIVYKYKRVKKKYRKYANLTLSHDFQSDEMSDNSSICTTKRKQIILREKLSKNHPK